MASPAETLAKLSGDFSLAADQNHPSLRTSVEARIHGLRSEPKSTRRDIRSVNSHRVGPTLQALIELMRGTTDAERLAQARLAEEQLGKGFKPVLPPTRPIPVIFEFDIGRDSNYDRPMIGHLGTSMYFDQTEFPAAIRGIDVVTKYPIGPKDQIAVVIETYPNKTYDPHKRADVDARDRALRGLAAGVGSLLHLKILSDLSKVYAGIFEPVFEKAPDSTPALDHGDLWIPPTGYVGGILRSTP